jgi:hypothetical protein
MTQPPIGVGVLLMLRDLALRCGARHVGGMFHQHFRSERDVGTGGREWFNHRATKQLKARGITMVGHPWPVFISERSDGGLKKLCGISVRHLS